MVALPLPRPAAHPRFVGLFHRRWSVPILAELARGRGAKLVTLRQRLGASRESLRVTLDALMAAGLVMRNPGYGHPLRPEYVLSPGAAALSPACGRIVRTLETLDAMAVGLRKWSLPVVWSIHRGHRRFAELKGSFDGITSRALSLALKDLPAAGLVERVVVDEYPPATLYELTSAGRKLARPLTALHDEVCAGF